MTKVLIAIQARSTSTRLPNKVMQMVGESTIIDRMIMTARQAANGLWEGVDVCCLIPKGDNLALYLYGYERFHEGSEENVLSRFLDVYEGYDYVVRLTADCPLLPSGLIVGHVLAAIRSESDYTENVDWKYRTYPDGMDVEVLSKKAMVWLAKNAVTKGHHEHVTTAIKELNPPELKRLHIANYVDLSHLSYTVDTPADLKRVQKEATRRLLKLENHKIGIGYL